MIDESVLGVDGAIKPLMPIIEEYARKSNGFVLEIGPGRGTGSTWAIQQGLKDHTNPLHVSVDHQDYMDWKPDVSWWFLVIGDSREHMTAALAVDDDRVPGLIFIDTDHNYEQMKDELQVWWPESNEETVWLFHDTYMLGKYNHMTDAIKEFAAEHNMIYEDITKESHGLGRMISKSKLGNKLNVGSGQRPFDHNEGWVNVDIQAKWNPDIIGDWNNLSMFDDSSVDMVVAHHTIEHIPHELVGNHIAEVNRVLRKGGSFIITIPDIWMLAKRWQMNQIDDYIFIVNMMGAYAGDEADRHKWHYTRESLPKELNAHGSWSKIVLFDWRKIAGADIAKDWWILGMEAIK